MCLFDLLTLRCHVGGGCGWEPRSWERKNKKHQKLVGAIFATLFEFAISGHLHRGWYGKVGGEEEGEGDEDEVEAAKWLSHPYFYFRGRLLVRPLSLLAGPGRLLQAVILFEIPTS